MTNAPMDADGAGARDDGDARTANLVVTKPKDIGDADFANYFCTYGYLYHQKDMLEDQNRMTAYSDAVRLNPDSFKGKVVLDVGTGSGVLAMWAAQAGAKKVYAVEATHMAVQARKIVAANGLSDVVEVIQGSMEEVELPEKVDVIISEWMGYFLLRESMFDSVLCARDKWMKPGGAMFPSHAKMYLSAIKSNKSGQKYQELQESLNVWEDFVRNTHENYGIDLSCMNGEYEDEQKEHYLNTAAWVDIHPSQVMAKPFTLASFDLNTCTMDDIKVLRDVDFKLRLFDGLAGPSGETRVGAFAGWFAASSGGRTATLAPRPRLVAVPAFTARPLCFFVVLGVHRLHLAGAVAPQALLQRAARDGRVHLAPLGLLLLHHRVGELRHQPVVVGARHEQRVARPPERNH